MSQEFKFRASQLHLIMTGKIGLTENQEAELENYKIRQSNAIMGKDKPLTATMHSKMLELLDKKANVELPKTMQNELKKIFIKQRFGRNFPFTNKYVQKGIFQEEEGITLFQQYQTKILKRPILFTKNEARLENYWISGEPDLGPKGVPLNEWEEGWDIKCSWSIDSFPLLEKELDFQYECQNQAYMWLTGAKKWHTVFTLVNGTEHQLNNEKLKWQYAYNSPDETDQFYAEMEKMQRECEIMMIYDYDRFVERYPFHNLLIKKPEWDELGLNMDITDRVIIKTSFFSEDFVDQAKYRIKIARNYLKEISNGH